MIEQTDFINSQVSRKEASFLAGLLAVSDVMVESLLLSVSSSSVNLDKERPILLAPLNSVAVKE